MSRVLRLILALCQLTCLPLLAEATALPADPQGHDSWLLENGHLSAVVSAIGGTLQRLVDKETGRDFVGGEGAFRDQFPPQNTAFAQAEYRGQIQNSPDGEARLELTAPGLEGVNQFTGIRKIYTLKPGEKLLRLQIVLLNQTESMQERRFGYWSNSFFGLPDTPNYLTVPLEAGAHRELSGSNTFFRNPVRGWLALDTLQSGVVLVPEYRKYDLAFSWNCLGARSRNTLEFRLVEESVPPGGQTVLQFAAGVFNALDGIEGAGEAGCGKVVTRNGQLTATLYGFQSLAATAVLLADGKPLGTKDTTLSAGKTTTVSFDLPPDATAATLEIRQGESLLFDLLHPLREGARFPAREQRNAPPTDQDPWQFTPEMDYVTPHDIWLETAQKPEIMVLVEANGLRDVVELRQRWDFRVAAPTVFPESWCMSWRNRTSFPPASGGESGTDKVGLFLTRRYDAIVLGSGRTTVRVNGRNLCASSWLAYPPATRARILEQLHAGTGLLLLNVKDADESLSDILASLHPAEAFLADSLSFAAAPHFQSASIRCGTYGAGRVAAVDFKTDCFLAPLPRWRGRNFQLLQCEHRFQEYQFAILARLLHWVTGAEPEILALKEGKPGEAIIRTAVAGKYDFELYNRHTERHGDFSLELPAGVSSFPLPPLQDGDNYLHARLAGRDFAFLRLHHTASAKIKAIRMKDHFLAGEPVHGTLELEGVDEDTSLIWEVTDGTGRRLCQGEGADVAWDARNAVVNRHILRAELSRKGRVASVRRHLFFLPETFDLRREYTNLLWVGADRFPEYTYPERFAQLRRFGFNFLYGGSFTDASPILLQFANVETGMNWYAGGNGYHLPYPQIQRQLADWYKTGDKRKLVRRPCFNSPDFNPGLPGREKEFSPFCTRRLFMLGDEMSMTHFQEPIDFCFCAYCLDGFRKWLQGRGWTLAQLNQACQTAFADWDEVMPQTCQEALFAPNPATFVLHRLYMDDVFAESLRKIQASILAKYPGGIVGPTGVKNTPHPYGGNWNFRNMSAFGCASIYGPPRLPVSFRRDERLVMRYYGYDTPEGETRHALWTGLFLGERNTNSWFCPIFLLPDLRTSNVRKYYGDLLWELRGGPGDLLYHAKKLTGQVAILHSQPSVIANFLKQSKVDYGSKEFAFAMALEDLGVAYRFIAPDELTREFLRSFQAVVLPETSALSDTELAVLKGFVQEGGKLVADYEPGVLNELCVPRRNPALDELFGVKTGQRGLRKVTSHTLSGVSIAQAQGNVSCTTGRALGEATLKGGGTVPLAVATAQTLYLNFAPQYSERREQAFRRLLSAFLSLESPAHFISDHAVMHGFFRNGRTLHIGLLAEPSFAGWRTATLKETARHSAQGELRLAQAAHLYDSRQGRELGHGTHFPLALAQGDGTLLTALPYRVAAIDLEAPTTIGAAEVATITAQIVTDNHAAPEPHVLVFQAFHEDGTESLEYRQPRLAPGGRFAFPFPPALNEKGRWRIQVRDAASGVTANCHIQVN